MMALITRSLGLGNFYFLFLFQVYGSAQTIGHPRHGKVLPVRFALTRRDSDSDWDSGLDDSDQEDWLCIDASESGT